MQQLTMMTRSRSLAASLKRTAANSLSGAGLARYQRSFHTTTWAQTDGVFTGLTDTRLRIPWIEALRIQQGHKDAQASETPKERDLTPKKMSDSYHRVVLPLGQDPWLSDTYINSSGHIR